MLAPISLHIAIIGHGKKLKSLRKFVWRKAMIVERIDNGSLWQAISAQFNFMSRGHMPLAGVGFAAQQFVDYLRAAAYAEDGKIILPGPGKKCLFSFIPLRKNAPVIAAGQEQGINAEIFRVWDYGLSAIGQKNIGRIRQGLFQKTRPVTGYGIARALAAQTRTWPYAARNMACRPQSAWVKGSTIWSRRPDQSS